VEVESPIHGRQKLQTYILFQPYLCHRPKSWLLFYSNEQAKYKVCIPISHVACNVAVESKTAGMAFCHCHMETEMVEDYAGTCVYAKKLPLFHTKNTPIKWNQSTPYVVKAFWSDAARCWHSVGMRGALPYPIYECS
jgi:hypothetical protein